MSPGTISLAIEHNFETAHRLPFLGGKCANLHGHSWKVKVAFVAYQHAMGMNGHGISMEYGLLKKAVRGWIDEHLDHGSMLGAQDLLAHNTEIKAVLGKVFVFGEGGDYPTMPWPTVEATARMLADKLQEVADQTFNDILWVDSVMVTETAVNSAVWIPSGSNDGRFDRFDARMYAQED